MKIFLDTNVLLRFYLQDVEVHFEQSKLLIEKIEEGKFQVYTSSIVFLEASFVLKTIYKIPHQEIIEILDSILSIRGITIIEKTNLRKALKLYSDYRIKFSDCLICSQLPKNTVLVTYDKEFAKIKELDCKTPDQIIEQNLLENLPI